MITQEEILEKLLRTNQLTEIINIANKDEVKEKLKDVLVWIETLYDRYYHESHINLANSLKLLEKNAELDRRMSEINKLNQVINSLK